MANMHVHITGLDEIIKDMNKATQRAFGEAVQNAVRLSGSECQEEAKRVVPVDTGFLKQSIGLTMTDNAMTAEVEPTAEYASYVEYGTRYMSAQPYMRPSFYKQEPKFKKDMEEIPKRLIGK